MYTGAFVLFLCVWAITKNIGIKTLNVALGSRITLSWFVFELQEKGFDTSNPQPKEIVSKRNCLNEKGFQIRM